MLSVVLMLQYVGAMWVLRPAGIRLIYSLCLVLISVVLLRFCRKTTDTVKSGFDLFTF